MASRKKIRSQRDPFWLGMAAFFTIIGLLLLVEHSRFAIILVVLIFGALLLYFYSNSFTKKEGKHELSNQ